MDCFSRRSVFSFVALLLFVAAPSLSHAQDADELGDALNNIGRDYADNYTQPITDALGGGLNAGLFKTADFGGTGLFPLIDVYVGVSAVGTFTSGSSDSFRLLNDEIQSNGRTLVIEYPDTELPTVFGEEVSPGQALIRDKQTGTPIETVELPPGLLNTSIAPLIVPQVGVGTVLGTDAQIRFLPETDISSYGSVSMVGLAVRHSISQYIPLFPVNVAVQGAWQSIGLSGTQQDDIVQATGWALNAQASKSVPVLPVTFYGGLQYESFEVDVDYTFETSAGTTDVMFSQTASNNFRALAGLSVSLAVARLNVDYALGSSNNVVSAGVGITL
jgi:hypothetical protein